MAIVHHGPVPLVVHEWWAESIMFSFRKINPHRKIPTNFVVSPLPFCEIKPRSTNFQEDPLIFESNSRYSFFLPYICNRNSDFGDSCAKIFRIIQTFISCIHNTCLLHVCFTLGNAVPEPFFEDFQDQAF
jgi:hypothetical protein